MQHANRVTARHRPLSATRFRDLWISWDDGVISVGTGTTVGFGRFMSWRDPHPHPIRYIAVSTGWGSTGLWHFTPVLDVSLKTGPVYHYQSLHSLGVNVAPQVTSFTFQVRAESNVHVALLQEDGVTCSNTYEIVIGGWKNTQSVIRKGRHNDQRVTARHRPLSATEFRDFWISWNDGVISVGTGMTVDVGRFMSWRDPSPQSVRYIAVSTGCGSTGLWQFERNIPLVCMETDDHYHPLEDLGFDLNGGTAFTFWVKARSDAYIALLSNRHKYDHGVIEIVIGGQGNTESVIRDRSQGPSRARTFERFTQPFASKHLEWWSIPDGDTFVRGAGRDNRACAHVHHTPLSGSKHLPFWISFSGDTIAVGAGREVGRRTFLSCTHQSSAQIRYVSVATGGWSNGKWLF
ncbi:uncharacterized protein [Haliotis asinina]